MFQRGYALEIPDKFDRLPNLRELYLNYMDLAPLPESISRLAKLEKLSLHHGIIRKIPSWIGKLTSLKELELTSKGYFALPDSIGDLHSLEKLSISQSGISTKLPTTICNLQNLQKLYAVGISIDYFDRRFTQLTNLKALVIGHPSDTIPSHFYEWFKYLKNLGCRVSIAGHSNDPKMQEFLVPPELPRDILDNF